MLCLAYDSADADLFSRVCVEQYDHRPTDSYGYLLAQVFEVSVLDEIATLEGCNLDALKRLEIGSGARIDSLRTNTDASSSKTPVQAVNIAAALISISRFALAERVLSRVN